MTLLLQTNLLVPRFQWRSSSKRTTTCAFGLEHTLSSVNSPWQLPKLWPAFESFWCQCNLFNVISRSTLMPHIPTFYCCVTAAWGIEGNRQNANLRILRVFSSEMRHTFYHGSFDGVFDDHLQLIHATVRSPDFADAAKSKRRHGRSDLSAFCQILRGSRWAVHCHRSRQWISAARRAPPRQIPESQQQHGWL
jgi:hypothetical protein